MGRGKGEVELYVARVPAGKILYAVCACMNVVHIHS